MNTRFLFFRPPTRDGNLYFRYEQYKNYLEKQGARVRVVAPNPKGEPFLRKLIAYPWRMARDLPKFVWAETIVLSPAPNMFWTVNLLKAMGKRVISEHYVSYLSHAEWIPHFPEWMDRWSYSSLSHIITHTDRMKEGLEKKFHLGSARVTSLYCGVDLDHFRPRPESDREKRRRELGLGDRFVVFYHGMHHTWHGMPVILDAMKRLSSDKQIVFVILPRSGFPDLPNAAYFGEEQPFGQLPSFLQAAHVWISGFSPEPRGDRSLSSTMIQAMAMGLPIITSRTPEKEKYMTHGENVLFVPPNDAITLADAILDASRNRETLSRIGAQARKLAEHSFSFNEQEPRLREIFLEPALS